MQPGACRVVGVRHGSQCGDEGAVGNLKRATLRARRSRSRWAVEAARRRSPWEEPLRLHAGGFTGGAADLAADSADLVSEVSLDHFSPDTAAFAILVRALFQASQ